MTRLDRPRREGVRIRQGNTDYVIAPDPELAFEHVREVAKGWRCGFLRNARQTKLAKGRVYLYPGEKAPEWADVKTSPRGARYYEGKTRGKKEEGKGKDKPEPKKKPEPKGKQPDFVIEYNAAMKKRRELGARRQELWARRIKMSREGETDTEAYHDVVDEMDKLYDEERATNRIIWDNKRNVLVWREAQRPETEHLIEARRLAWQAVHEADPDKKAELRRQANEKYKKADLERIARGEKLLPSELRDMVKTAQGLLNWPMEVEHVAVGGKPFAQYEDFTKTIRFSPRCVEILKSMRRREARDAQGRPGGIYPERETMFFATTILHELAHSINPVDMDTYRTTVGKALEEGLTEWAAWSLSKKFAREITGRDVKWGEDRRPEEMRDIGDKYGMWARKVADYARLAAGEDEKGLPYFITKWKFYDKPAERPRRISMDILQGAIKQRFNKSMSQSEIADRFPKSWEALHLAIRGAGAVATLQGHTYDTGSRSDTLRRILAGTFMDEAAQQRLKLEKAILEKQYKVYLQPGEDAPAGLAVQEGPRGGHYVEVGLREKLRIQREREKRGRETRPSAPTPQDRPPVAAETGSAGDSDWVDDPWDNYPDAPPLPRWPFPGQEVARRASKALARQGRLNDDGTVSLYHVTMSDNVDNILKDGLIPARQPAPGQTWKAEHSSYATYFHGNDDPAIRDYVQSGTLEDGSPIAAIIEARLPVHEDFLRRVIPDEDVSPDTNKGLETLLRGEAVAIVGGIPAKNLRVFKTTEQPERWDKALKAIPYKAGIRLAHGDEWSELDDLDQDIHPKNVGVRVGIPPYIAQAEGAAEPSEEIEPVTTEETEEISPSEKIKPSEEIEAPTVEKGAPTEPMDSRAHTGNRTETTTGIVTTNQGVAGSTDVQDSRNAPVTLAEIAHAEMLMRLAAMGINKAKTNAESDLPSRLDKRGKRRWPSPLERVNQEIGRAKKAIENATRALWREEIDLDAWHSQMKAAVDDLYGKSAYASVLRLKEAPDVRARARDNLLVELRHQHHFLDRFRDDMAAGRVKTEKQAVWRARLYGEGAGGLYNQTVSENLPQMKAYWHMTPTAAHCNTCLQMAKDSPWPSHQLPRLPRDGSTDCRGNCKCFLTYRRAKPRYTIRRKKKQK